MTAEPAKPAFPAMPMERAHALMCAPGSLLEIGEADIHGVRTKIWKNAPSA
jgi:long-chain acyl-CoA synthetase